VGKWKDCRGSGRGECGGVLRKLSEGSMEQKWPHTGEERSRGRLVNRLQDNAIRKTTLHVWRGETALRSRREDDKKEGRNLPFSAGRDKRRWKTRRGRCLPGDKNLRMGGPGKLEFTGGRPGGLHPGGLVYSPPKGERKGTRGKFVGEKKKGSKEGDVRQIEDLEMGQTPGPGGGSESPSTASSQGGQNGGP